MKIKYRNRKSIFKSLSLRILVIIRNCRIIRFSYMISRLFLSLGYVKIKKIKF